MLLAVDGFFSRSGLSEFGFRWLHILAGIVWIGLLYYFNLVQVPAFAEYDSVEGGARARNIALDKVARRALWWFRWAAVSTFVTGILIAVSTKDFFANKDAEFNGISMGMLLGTIMLLNVWGVIWRNQKVVLANAATVVGGGAANPDAPAAGRRAFMASRQNVVFSVSMLYFMVFAAHAPYRSETPTSGGKAAFWIIALIVIVILELNALGFMPWKVAPKKGLNMIYDTVQNVLIGAFGLWVIFLLLSEFGLKP